MKTLTLLTTLVLSSSAFAFTPDQLWDGWPQERFVRTPAPCIRPAGLNSELERLAGLYPETLRLEEIGRSVQGRPIHMMTLGHGPRTVLLWSQMHGDEPSATPALLDMVHFLLATPDRPEAAAILDDLTLLMIPMLNPDGSEVYQRRNFQAIDINRDAIHLATPEGRLLKAIRDQYQPMLGFNLHDQRRRTAVGETGVLATNSVLAVAGDAEGTTTPGRLLAQRACSAIVQTLEPFIPGGLARFNEDWNPRAFGDNITAWGTPVVLLESGGLPPGRDLEDLTRLNFVAILTVLQELVRNDLGDYSPEIYENLVRNRSNAWVDVVVRGGFIQQPGSGPAYRADLAFNIDVDDRDAAGCATGQPPRSSIAEIGDAGFLGTGRVVDAADGVLAVPFTVAVDGWKARRWLDAGVLAELAGLGVGSVSWKVPGRKIEAARTLAVSLNGRGRARLEVDAVRIRTPQIRLTGPPKRPATNSLADVARALAGSRGTKDLSGPELLDRLVGTEASLPMLRRGRPASFVLLSPAVDGVIDPDTTRLTAVVVDGFEVRGGSR